MSNNPSKLNLKQIKLLSNKNDLCAVKIMGVRSGKESLMNLV